MKIKILHLLTFFNAYGLYGVNIGNYAIKTCANNIHILNFWSARRFATTHYEQTYGVTTHDPLFKLVLSNNKIRPSFLKTFIPDLQIVSSKRLDEHMNPLQELRQLRNLLADKKVQKHANDVRKNENMQIGYIKDNQFTIDKNKTAFLRKLLSHYEDMCKAFPKEKYDGTMDFVCKLKEGDYAMVEIQVIPTEHWDRRALAYTAAFYANQLKKGEDWPNIRKMISLNILGGGKNDVQHWPDTPNQFMRHYKFQEQLHKPGRIINGMELVQYSIMNAPKTLQDQALNDWVTFLKRGHFMTEEDVKDTIKTKEVLLAFEEAKIKKFTPKFKDIYDDADYAQYNYSAHAKKIVQEGIQEGMKKGRKKGRAEGKAEGQIEAKAEIVRNMLKKSVDIETISEFTELSIPEIEKLSGKHKKHGKK